MGRRVRGAVEQSALGFGPSAVAKPGLVLLASAGEPASSRIINLQNLDTAPYDVLMLFFVILRGSAVELLNIWFNADVGVNYNTEQLHQNSGGVGQVQFQNQSRRRLTFSLAEFTAHPAAGELTSLQCSRKYLAWLLKVS